MSCETMSQVLLKGICGYYVGAKEEYLVFCLEKML